LADDIISQIFITPSQWEHLPRDTDLIGHFPAAFQNPERFARRLSKTFGHFQRLFVVSSCYPIALKSVPGGYWQKPSNLCLFSL
jgi:hypothetical protein